MYNTSKLLSFIVFFVSVIVADAKPQTFILGGKNATKGQFPYQASFRQRSAQNEHICSGSIISSRYILTSGSRLFRATVSDVYALVGALRLSEAGTEVNFEEIIIHPYFDQNAHRNDIALVRTVDDIIFSKLIQPVDLPDIDIPIQPPIKGSTSGWGYTLVKY